MYANLLFIFMKILSKLTHFQHDNSNGFYNTVYKYLGGYNFYTTFCDIICYKI